MRSGGANEATSIGRGPAARLPDRVGRAGEHGQDAAVGTQRQPVGPAHHRRPEGSRHAARLDEAERSLQTRLERLALSPADGARREPREEDQRQEHGTSTGRHEATLPCGCAC
jgi:hypothetical protein